MNAWLWLKQSLSEISLTAWVAIYGAALATVNAVWSWRRSARDRGRLLVRASLGRLHTLIPGRGTIGDGGAELLALTLTNIGTKPVHLTTIGGGTKRKGEPEKYFDVLVANPEHLVNVGALADAVSASGARLSVRAASA